MRNIPNKNNRIASNEPFSTHEYAPTSGKKMSFWLSCKMQCYLSIDSHHEKKLSHSFDTYPRSEISNIGEIGWSFNGMWYSILLSTISRVMKIFARLDSPKIMVRQTCPLPSGLQTILGRPTLPRTKS